MKTKLLPELIEIILGFLFLEDWTKRVESRKIIKENIYKKINK